MAPASPRASALLKVEVPAGTVQPGNFYLCLLLTFIKHIAERMNNETVLFRSLSFGVCCLFLVSATGATINQNCTYLRNPGFPSVYSSTSSLSYTVSKCSSGNMFYESLHQGNGEWLVPRRFKIRVTGCE